LSGDWWNCIQGSTARDCARIGGGGLMLCMLISLVLLILLFLLLLPFLYLPVCLLQLLNHQGPYSLLA